MDFSVKRSMGLFGFGKKKQRSKEYQYSMLFQSPINSDRDQQIKTLALKYIGDAGASVHDVKTTSFAPYGSRADFTGEAGECISIVCAGVPGNESNSSYIAITVRSNVCTEEAVKNAFYKIRLEVIEKGFYFTEF